MGCGARDKSRIEQGVKHSQHGHGVGHHPSELTHPNSRGKGVLQCARGKPSCSNSGGQCCGTGKREDNSAITSRCRQKQLLESENAYVAHGSTQAPKPLQKSLTGRSGS